MRKNIYRSHTVLILNRLNRIKNNSFYRDLFRIPEVLNRLRQYKELLNENHIRVPLWVYGLNQGIKSLTEGLRPSLLNLIVGMGLFDRWTNKNGWPRYIIGSHPLISLITGETSFEEPILLSAKKKHHCKNNNLYLYQAGSYYNQQTESFCLTSLKQKQVSPYLKEILDNLHETFKKNNETPEEWIFQLLLPHEESLMANLKNQGILPRDFMEWDQNLKWLWPVWKRTQMQIIKNNPLAHFY